MSQQPFQIDDLIEGDARIVLQKFPANFFDSVVTDPPYELGFMGKKWDGTGVAYDPLLWMECLRVLKPGGYLLAFSSARTYHRMACAIEDAGFEIRDQIMLIYGSGMAKGMDISKAIDKKEGAKREIEILFPSPIFCTDNAAMIGSAAYFNYQERIISDLDINAKPNLKLGEA